MSNRRFTIIATVRNESSTIRAFVDSLIGQNRVPEEILIVDGASTDGTLEILREYEHRGAIRVISRPCNIAEGRNLGIAAASGTHLAVTDAGCRVDPDWLAQIDHCFASDCQPDVVAGNFRFETHTRFEEAVVKATFQPNRDDTEAARFYPSSRSVAFSKEAWAKAGGYPEWLYAAEDTLFNIRLRQLGLRFAFCRDAIVQWRPRETWRALARQRVNFARGNARVGIGTSGYHINLRVHAQVAAALLAGAISPLFLVLAGGLLAWHVQQHLWPQVKAVTDAHDWAMRLHVLGVMEFVRLVNLYGFMLGRRDRLTDERFVKNQIAYMGVASVDELGLDDAPGHYRRTCLDLQVDASFIYVVLLSVVAIVCAVVAWVQSGAARWPYVVPPLGVAVLGTLLLLAKSVRDFTQTGPRIREEVLKYYRHYTMLALLRLSAWAFAIMFLTAGAGVLAAASLAVVLDWHWTPGLAILSACSGILGAFVLQFLHALRFNPGLLVASMQYRLSRIYSLWRFATPTLLATLQIVTAGFVLGALMGALAELSHRQMHGEQIALGAAGLFYAALIVLMTWEPEARKIRASRSTASGGAPNILMIGSDTMRADRLGALGYRRTLTPHIDGLAAQGTLFANCYVPCARTAPSLISMLTGTWPHTHGVRDNYNRDEDTRLNVDGLPRLLKARGYRTAVLSDWCGGDMGKFSFGFDHTDLPHDQWNLKYLIKQGPKDLRLFVSLFTHNRIGRALLPETYYLGGVPLTRQMGRRARRLVSRLASQTRPFFLNVFFSTTHPPFASEWPWYARFADKDYKGESKFAMARLTDPFDIIRRQGAPKEEFDLDQIINLYDGTVAQFDDEVGRMLAHIEACGLANSTIVVLYSDHGMEFFEHDTWGQGNSAVGEASPRIPLVIHDPRVTGRGRIDSVVRSIDLAPTLLELAGAPASPAMDGVSLASCLRANHPFPDLDAFNETGIWLAEIPGLPDTHLRYPDLLELLEVPNLLSGTLSIKPEYEERILAAKDRMIRRGRWKLVYQPTDNDAVIRLFDVEADPGCKVDRFADHPDIVDDLWKALAAWIAGNRVR